MSAALTLAFVLILFIGLDRHRRWARGARAAFLVFLLLGASLFGVGVGRQIRHNLDHVPEWDFLGFWLHARTAVSGESFYDPANARALASPFQVSKDFEREIVDTGFWYPPPSMFLYLPLGWLEPHAALVGWYAFHVAVLALDVLLLWKIFFPGGAAVELAACAALVLACGGTLSTFHFSQTNFVALLALLLFWRLSTSAWGGHWASVAMWVKPFLAVLALCLLAARRGRAFLGFMISSAALVLASLVAFGPRTFLDFFAGLGHPKPQWIYSEPTNQSILGFVLRVTEAHCHGPDCVANPIYLAIAFVLCAVTIPLGITLARTHAEWMIALVLLLALLVYPVSQLFYSVLLIPPLLVLWRDRTQVPGATGTVAILGAAVYALAALDAGRATLAASALLWGAMALFGARIVRRGVPLAVDARSGRR